MVQQSQITEALKKIQDPDLKQDIVTLNYLRDMQIGEGTVTALLVFPSPASTIQETIVNEVKITLEEVVGKGVKVVIKTGFEVTTKRDSTHDRLPNIKNLIAVASGKGGVGKSTVTANLAIALQKLGAKVGILDADIYGPSIPMMFGVQSDQPQMIEKDGRMVMQPLNAHGIELMSIGFLVPPEQSTVWRGPMATKAFQQILLETDWGELDYLLLDVPPGTGDVHLTIVQTIPVTGVMIVTTPQPVAIADATKCVDMFLNPQIQVPVLGVAENMSFFVPDDAPEKKYFIFGENGADDFAKKFDLPLLGQIPLTEDTRSHADEGKPIALEKDHLVSNAFLDLASTVARKVAIRNVTKQATKVVQITRK